MSTRENILTKSLELFNRYGLPNVSQRKITEALSISPGNLTYHFRKKEEIQEALYFQLVEKVDIAQKELKQNDVSLQTLTSFIDALFELFFDYRFIFLDIVYLMKTNQKIAAHYAQLLKIRRKQFLDIIDQLISSGIIRKELLPNEYPNLYTRIQILTDFYFSAVEVSEGGVKKEDIQKYRMNILYSIYPYLTKKGISQFPLKS